jgi:hypothetical protein
MDKTDLKEALEAMYPMVRGNELYTKEMFVGDMTRKILDIQKNSSKKILVDMESFEETIKALKAENERLKDELGNWRYALAYCSMEEMPADDEVIPTPKGVKKFIDELLEEKTRLKHILTARNMKKPIT